MARQSIFRRIMNIFRANSHAALDAVEDPQKMLDQLNRDFADNIGKAETSIAETIGNLNLLRADREDNLNAATNWGAKAVSASQRADTYRSRGDIENADKYDALAKSALGRQIRAESNAAALEAPIESQAQVVEQLKVGLNSMREKQSALAAKSASLVARKKTADAQSQMLDAAKAVNVSDPSSELGRFESNIRRQEALVAGKAELAASSLDAQFNELEDLGELSLVEDRLAALKSGGSRKSIGN